MRIESINWLSKEAKEAELTVTDGIHSVTVFSQPCKYVEGQSIEESLHVFMAKNIMLSHDSEVSIKKKRKQTVLIYRC